MIKKLILLMIMMSLFFMYLVFMFYDELFRKGTFMVKFNTEYLSSFNFMKKKMIAYNFPVMMNMDLCSIASKFFKSLSIFNFNLNLNINISFNFFKSPGVRLYLLLSNFLYNFVMCYFFICLNWAFSLHAEAVKLGYAHPLNKELTDMIAMKSTFYLFMLLILELLFLLIIMHFMWQKFEYAVLMPLNLFILFYISFCFLFYFFCKSFAYLFIYMYTYSSWAYYFKANFMNFYNNLWLYISFIIWYSSPTIIKMLMYVYIFITFNLSLFLIYMHIYKIMFF